MNTLHKRIASEIKRGNLSIAAQLLNRVTTVTVVTKVLMLALQKANTEATSHATIDAETSNLHKRERYSFSWQK